MGESRPPMSGRDHWSAALKIALDLEAKGLLPAREPPLLEVLRQPAGGGGRP